jgi:hypothetical protein
MCAGLFKANGTLPPTDNQHMPEPVCGASGQFTFGPAVCGCSDGTAPGTATAWPTLAAAFELGQVTGAAQPQQRRSLILSVDDLGASARFFGKTLPEYQDEVSALIWIYAQHSSMTVNTI